MDFPWVFHGFSMAYAMLSPGLSKETPNSGAGNPGASGRLHLRQWALHSHRCSPHRWPPSVTISGIMRVNQWINQLENESMNRWVNEWMKEGRKELINEWMTEWMNEWMNESNNQWINKSINQQMNPIHQWLRCDFIINQWTKLINRQGRAFELSKHDRWFNHYVSATNDRWPVWIYGENH